MVGLIKNPNTTKKRKKKVCLTLALRWPCSDEKIVKFYPVINAFQKRKT